MTSIKGVRGVEAKQQKKELILIKFLWCLALKKDPQRHQSHVYWPVVIPVKHYNKIKAAGKGAWITPLFGLQGDHQGRFENRERESGKSQRFVVLLI